TELRLNNVDIDILRNAGSAGFDLALLTDAYQRYLAEAGLADSAQIFRTAASIVREGQYRFRGFPVVMVDIAARSQLERAFIHSVLVAAGPALIVCTPRDERTVTFLREAMKLDAEDSSNVASTALSRLRQFVFA